MLDQTIQIIDQTKPAFREVVSKTIGEEDQTTSKVNFFLSIFALLVSAMEIRQHSVLTESKMIAANSEAQHRLNKQNGDIKFSILPYNADNAMINRVQDKNQQYAAIREDIQNFLITARQDAQIEMTQASTNINLLQQNASEDSNWLRTLNTIFQGICEMVK
ncbi:MAG: DUF720 domain-containing protein [Chlamydiales bacterium]